MITILSKGYDPELLAETCITKSKGMITPEIFTKIIRNESDETDYYKVRQKYLYDEIDNQIRLSGIRNFSRDPIQELLIKIRQNGQLMGELCNINQGIITGADKVTKSHLRKYDIEAEIGSGIFVLNKSEILDLNLEEPDKKILKPFYKNSDISRWCTNNVTDEFVIYADKNLKNLRNNQIRKNLKKYKTIINNSSSNSPYLHRPRSIKFDDPKILAPQRSPLNTFAYNEKRWYAASDVFFITQKDKSINLKYVLANLNSKLFYVWLYFRGKRKGENLELIAKPLSNIPIKKISLELQKPFINIVDKILCLTCSEDYLNNQEKQREVKMLESKIDKMIYELYELTEAEIEAIEKFKQHKL
jgi:adenine-specific DNA-methyltransferase